MDGLLAGMAGEAGAGDRLREAVRLPGFTDTPDPDCAPEMALARWYLYRGELDPARDLLNAVVAVAERYGSDAAAAAVAAVIPEARQRRLPFELGRCLLVLGTTQRKARRRRAAAASLDEAIAVFAGLGAARWQALAAAQRARLAPGPDQALTATERRIAGLVAAGQTNPQIAAALYISVKTVEANLTRIYRKLGLRGRVDLARRSPA